MALSGLSIFLKTLCRPTYNVVFSNKLLDDLDDACLRFFWGRLLVTSMVFMHSSDGLLASYCRGY